MSLPLAKRGKAWQRCLLSLVKAIGRAMAGPGKRVRPNGPFVVASLHHCTHPLGHASHSAPWSRLASWARRRFFHGSGGGDKFRLIIVAGVSRDSL
jgi:hypothetical protein